MTLAFVNAHEILSIYIPWPFPPVWGIADNREETTKQWGFHSVLLAMTGDPAEFGWHCWSNTAHPPPSSTTYVASYMPSPLLPLPQGCLYKATPWQRQKYLHIICHFVGNFFQFLHGIKRNILFLYLLAKRQIITTWK